MTRCDAGNTGPENPAEEEVPATVHCKLFSDKVSEPLCLLRKKELNLKGAFSCEGCAMDAVIRKRLKQVTDILGLTRDRNEQKAVHESRTKGHGFYGTEKGGGRGKEE